MYEMQGKDKKLIDDVLRESVSSVNYNFMRKNVISNVCLKKAYYAGRVRFKNLPKPDLEKRVFDNKYIGKSEVKKNKFLFSDYYLQAQNIHERRLNGEKLKDIAKDLGVSTSTARKREKEFFDLDEVKKAKQRIYVEQAKQVEELRKEGLSYRLIGERLHISETVARGRKKYLNLNDVVMQENSIRHYNDYEDETLSHLPIESPADYMLFGPDFKYELPYILSNEEKKTLIDGTNRISELMNYLNNNADEIKKSSLARLLLHGCNILNNFVEEAHKIEKRERSHLIRAIGLKEYDELLKESPETLADEFIYHVCGGRSELCAFFLEEEKFDLVIAMTEQLLKCWDDIKQDKAYIFRSHLDEKRIELEQANLFLYNLPNIVNQTDYIEDVVRNDKDIFMVPPLYEFFRNSISRESEEELKLKFRNLPRIPRNIDELIEMNLPRVFGEFKQKNFYFWYNGLIKIAKQLENDNLDTVRDIRKGLRKKYLEYGYQRTGYERFDEELKRIFLTVDSLFKAKEKTIINQEEKDFFELLIDDLRTNYIDCVHNYWDRKKDIEKYRVFEFNADELRKKEIDLFDFNYFKRAAVSSLGVFYSEVLEIIFGKRFVKRIFDLDESEMSALKKQMRVMRSVKKRKAAGSKLPDLYLYKKFKLIA